MPRMRGWFDDDRNPYIPDYVSSPAYNYLAESQSAIRSGSALESHGKLLQKTAPYSLPSVAHKVWSPYRKHELQHLRRTSPAGMRSEFYAYPISKYDHRPGKLARFRNIQRHYARSHGRRKAPKGGYYSKPNPGNVKAHQKARYAQGTGLRGSGILLKTLGWMGVAYSAYYLVKNPGTANANMALAMLIGGIKYSSPAGIVAGHDSSHSEQALASELNRQTAITQSGARVGVTLARAYLSSRHIRL